MSDEKVILKGDIFHHIVHVCRQEPGSHFEVLTEDSIAYLVRLKSVGRQQAEAEVIEQRTIPPLPMPYIHLCLSVPRFPTLETVIEKSVELGVHTLRPFVSDHSFVRSAAKVPAGKFERWRKIVQSATQQTGRGDLIAIAPVQTLEQLLESFNRETQTRGLFPYEGEAALSVKEALKDLGREGLKAIWVFVGSEGGFSQREIDLFGRYGLQPMTMGPQVLRVETACLALVSVIKYEFDLMQGV